MSSAAGAIEAGQAAAPLQISEWLNIRPGEDLSLDALRDRVVVLHAFQMLCPGCVSHGLPQAQRIAAHFDASDVVVLGLHSVFEHHDAMTPTALRAFVHEYRWSFPIGIDKHAPDGATPLTMRAYGMRGTPTLIVIDRIGRVRQHWFGRPSDLEVGSAISAVALGTLLRARPQRKAADRRIGCTEDHCGFIVD